MRKLLSVMVFFLLTVVMLPLNVEAEEVVIEVNSWESLGEALVNADRVILTADIKGDADSVSLYVPFAKPVTLDLNGHILDRGLTEAKEDGYVVKVLGGLVIIDSNPNATHDPAITYTDPVENKTVTVNGGIITGGYNSGDGGAIHNEGLLFLQGGTLCGNKGYAGGAILNGTSASKDIATFYLLGGAILGNVSTSSHGGAIKNVATMDMQGGLVSGNEVAKSNANGGAVWNANVMKISGGTISNNRANNGGAIVSSASLTITGGSISGNRAVCGGAIYCRRLMINGGTISDNEASDKGGAIYSVTAGYNVTMNGGVIDNNKAQLGGGLYVDQNWLYINGGTISNNIAYSEEPYCGGGGIFIAKNGDCNMNGGTISGNKAYHDGGGVCAHGKISIYANSLITGNDANYGGGVYAAPNEDNKVGRILLSGGKIHGNTATYLGGGVYVQSGAEFELQSGEVIFNSVKQRAAIQGINEEGDAKVTYTDGFGGGIYSRGSLQLYGGTITQNMAAYQGGGVYADTSVTVSGDVFIQGNVVGTKADDVYLCKDHNIKVNKPLTRMIGVNADNMNFVITSDLSGKGTALNFFSNRNGYDIILNQTGEAIFQALSYEIAVDKNIENGTISVDKTIALTDETVTLTITPALNYELDKVMNSASGTEIPVTPGENGKYTFAMPAERVVVSPTYKLKKYSVTFVDEDGKTVLKEATEYDYGTAASAIQKPADPTKKATEQYTYTFAGWTPKIDMVTGDVVYKATYTSKVNKYKVTFVDEDGKTILKAATEYDYGTAASAIEKPADPTKKATAKYNYTFAGWTPKIDTVTGDITYTATYSSVVNKYKVTFVDEDGKTILKAATEYDYGTAASAIKKPADPTKEATAKYTYTFAGWTPEIGKVTEDITYKATYSSVLNKFKVTFVDEDRSTVLKATAAYDYGTTFTDFEKPADPTKAATKENTFTFVGWTPETDAVTGDITYIATYSVVVNKYKVTYVDDDGITILKDAIEYAFGTSAADYEKPADPEKKATAQYTYHFTGWKPQVDTTTGDITYIATYSSVVNKYKVTFVDEDGKTILKDAIAYDYGTAASDIAKPEVPTKAATTQYTYTFAGWTPKIDVVTGDITYTATYSSVVNKYKVTFVDEDGTTVLKAATEYDYGTIASAIEKPADPTKEATAQYSYTFAGWTPQIDAVTGDITYKATYSSVVNKYKVTFVDEDETTILKDTVEYDYGTAEKDIVKPEDPTKQATEQYTYTFAGWTPEINVVTGDITYVATYEAEEIIAPPVISYIVKRGADGSWIQNDSVGYTLAADRIGDDQKCSDHYVATWIDQKKVPVSTKEGSIIITIAPETLKELSVGEHTIKVEFDDGSVETKLTVKAAPEPDAPIAAPTGNDGYLWLWIYALGASLASMAVMGLSGKKRRVK